MKKILAFVLAILVVTSLFALSGCKKAPAPVPEYARTTNNIHENEFDDFETHVDADSEIIGEWLETSTGDEVIWTFFASTTLHLTYRSKDATAFSTIGCYNFDDESGELLIRIQNESEHPSLVRGDYTYTAKLEEGSMTLTSADGKDVRSFTKLES
ncbi:MAG: hypothetical protein IJV88_06305 [Ruminococcus sp.]|nr:hypothetical protein [Ruminococcus sp.]